jgi:hypothetical protein
MSAAESSTKVLDAAIAILAFDYLSMLYRPCGKLDGISAQVEQLWSDIPVSRAGVSLLKRSPRHSVSSY